VGSGRFLTAGVTLTLGEVSPVDTPSELALNFLQRGKGDVEKLRELAVVIPAESFGGILTD
jgi:hypothetical protein